MEPDGKKVSMYLVRTNTRMYAYNACGAGSNQINLGPPDTRGRSNPLDPADFPGGVLRVLSTYKRQGRRAVLKDHKYAITFDVLAKSQALWGLIRDGVPLSVNDWADLH